MCNTTHPRRKCDTGCARGPGGGRSPRRRPGLSAATLATAVAVLLLAAALGAPAVDAQTGTPILGYRTTFYNVVSDWLVQDSARWAIYDDKMCRRSDSSFYAGCDFTANFLPLAVRTDLFYRTNARLYASSYGFVSLTNYSMCGPSFCADSLPNTLFGTYQFDGVSAGGDWPMIALYVAETYWSMQPAAGNLCVSALSSEVNAGGERVSWQTVDYQDFPVRYSPSNGFSGQTVIFSNGSIVFRYRTVAQSNYRSPTSDLPPSVGLVLSKLQRISTTAPVNNDAYVSQAIRYDPVRDGCAAVANEATCVGSNDGAGALGQVAGCGWCTATRACMSRRVAADMCPASYIRYSGSGADEEAAALYDVEVTQNACAARAQENTSYSPYTVSTLRTSFPFTIFGQPPTDAPSTTTLYMQASSVYGVQTPGSGTSCNPLWNYCVDGNYTNTIATFLSATSTDGPLTSGAAHRYADSSSGAGDSVRIASMPFAAFSVRQSAFPDSHPTFNYELVLRANGTIEMLFGCNVSTEPRGDEESADASSSSSSSSDSSGDSSSGGEADLMEYFIYPPALVGVLRRTVSDPASAIIPPLLVRQGTSVRFTLKSTCPPCSPNGSCDAATGTCVCAAGFTGGGCAECAAGYYGPSCSACGACENGGRCADGVNGSGMCSCPQPFAGRKCETSCDATGGRRTCDSAACVGSGHGYCECDRCTCLGGYANGDGGLCSVAPRDQCGRHSLEGCRVCAAASGCAFCFTSFCFNPSLSGGDNGYACSYTVAMPPTCRALLQPVSVGADMGYLLLGALTALIAVLYVILGALIAHAVRQIRVYNYDVHAAVAAGGVLDYKPTRREREIVQTQLVFEDRVKERPHVLGFVLKQISLRKLYKRQRGIEGGGGTGSADNRAGHD